MKKYIEVIEELENRNIDMLGLEIAYELKVQLDFTEREFTEEQKEELFTAIERAYLKSDDLTIEAITRKAIELYDELENMTTWDLIEESCY